LTFDGDGKMVYSVHGPSSRRAVFEQSSYRKTDLVDDP
jgi:hypothetical protein